MGPGARRSLAFPVLLALLLGVGGTAQAKPPRLYGPMVGHVSPTSAVLWVYTSHAPGVRVWYRPAAVPASAARSVDLVRNHRVTLPDLTPDTGYVYRVVYQGETFEHWTGSFRTPPRAGTPHKFRMAVSSCMKPDHGDQHAFVSLLAEQSDFQLLLGDNVYADSLVRDVVWRHYLEMRGVWQFAEVLRQVPTYALWDDHDFAGDNIGGAQVPQRARVLDIFREVWANPSYGIPGVPGVFFKLTWGDVDIFVLDGRYYRSALKDPNGTRKRMIGDAQFAWFAREIAASKAPFKFIASGSTLELEGTDTWAAYNYDRNRIWGLIREQRIGGVIWLSGDLHEGLVAVHPKAMTGFYDLYEVISSGIANSRDHEFAVLDVDTTVADPTCAIRILDGQGKLVQEERVTRSMLRVRP